MYEVKIIEDSLYKGSRLTTFQLRYPRFIHAEFMTHRVFSRNASSSRAIPVSKMIEMVKNEPAMPVHWGKNQKGMQAEEELSPEQAAEAKYLWILAAQNAAAVAESMNDLGLHKQVANRILEPFQWMSVVVTSTDWNNFFELRSHPDAQPEIKKLSDMMMNAYDAAGTEPKQIRPGQYHLPYIMDEERNTLSVEEQLKCSVARCARVSYLTHDNEKPFVEKDLELYYRLVGSNPKHMSPCEHQARPSVYGSANFHAGNFDDRWEQFRKYVEKDNAPMFFLTEPEKKSALF